MSKATSPRRELAVYVGRERIGTVVELVDGYQALEPTGKKTGKFKTRKLALTAIGSLLAAAASERIRKSRLWPKTAAQLGNRVKRAKPVLEHKGFAVGHRHSGTRTIILVPPRQTSRDGSSARNCR